MKTTNNIQKKAIAAQQEGAWLQEQEAENNHNSELSKVLLYLAPWIEKTNGEESVGSWETTMATKMMVKLLELWLTPQSRERIEKTLEYYHPLDRSAMAYALIIFMMTGRIMTFKSALANQHYKIICKMMKEDMPELLFANHIKYMVRKYGKKKAVKAENSNGNETNNK